MKSNAIYHTSGNQYWPLGIRLENPSQLSSWKARFGKLIKALLTQLTSSSEPFVWQSPNDASQNLWNAHDRVSGKVIRHASEAEIRVWLEERYSF